MALKKKAIWGIGGAALVFGIIMLFSVIFFGSGIFSAIWSANKTLIVVLFFAVLALIGIFRR